MQVKKQTTNFSAASGLQSSYPIHTVHIHIIIKAKV